MRLLPTLAIAAVVAVGGYYAWNNESQIQQALSQYIENGDILTLEARYTAEQIMNTHRQELLVDSQHTFQDATLKFHPHLLIEAKFTGQNKKTQEGVILWSLVDGEMVLNTESWEKTHGFYDALLVNANRNDFRVLNALAANGGCLTCSQLQKELHLEQDIIEPWIDSASEKRLIVRKGNDLQLHFQNPKILVVPQTKISQWLVTKPYSHVQRLPKRFNQKQIEKITAAAFGNDFTIRTMKEVALPVYSIEVLNPDGSIHTSYWNALSGQRIAPNALTYR